MSITSESRDAHTAWTGVGHQTVGTPRSLAHRATSDALSGRSATLLVVFAAATLDATEVLLGCNEAAPGVPVVGCTTAGEVSTSGPADGGVVVMALGGSSMSAAVGHGLVGVEGVRAAATAAASCVAEVQQRRYTTLLVLCDGSTGDQQDVVRGAYDVAGPTVPLVGGVAGGVDDAHGAALFTGEHVIAGGVVAAAISTDRPVGIGVRHGWSPEGDVMIVTESDGVVVSGIDGCPALDEYLRHFDAPPQIEHDPELFEAFARIRPLGVQRRGRTEVRCVAGCDPEARTLIFFAEVPERASVRPMTGDDQSVLVATNAACDDALAALDGMPPSGLIVFDCAARKGLLGDFGIRREIAQIHDRVPEAPIAGLYTFGEIARVTGASGFHNQTIVVMAVS